MGVPEAAGVAGFEPKPPELDPKPPGVDPTGADPSGPPANWFFPSGDGGFSTSESVIIPAALT